MAREISLAAFVLVHEDHQPIQYGRGFRFDIALVEVEEDIVQDDRSLNLRRRRRWRRWWWRWWRLRLLRQKICKTTADQCSRQRPDSCANAQVKIAAITNIIPHRGACGSTHDTAGRCAEHSGLVLGHPRTARQKKSHRN